MRLFQPDGFSNFGTSRFRPADLTAPTTRIKPRSARMLRSAVRDACPRRPGVYGMLDRRGHLIYVGKAKSLRARLLSYFRPNSRNHKAGRIIESTRCLIWEETTSEFAALLRELELIQRHLPMFNVQGKPGRQRYRYVCIGRGPVPYVYSVMRPTGKEQAVYGPLVGARRVDEAVRKLNHWFGLRDCSSKISLGFAEQAELFDAERSPRCLRYELGNCLGPCIKAVHSRDYRQAVNAAKRFLEGRNSQPIDQLTKEMLDAATSCQFERAAALRDKLGELQWLIDRLTWVQHARDQHSFIYPHGSANGRTMWYIVHRGQVRNVTLQPRTLAEGEVAARLIQESFSANEPLGQPLAVGQVDSVLLVAAWFRKHAEARQEALTATEALAKCAGLPLELPRLAEAIALAPASVGEITAAAK
ncbi:GIY-YIG nuclease family protein [Tuwongella immobilis]|uniref:GIY-YIG domain-containing protein n=1 Tax=Tuwongella immobilis TaxID=692036 RepID=A0A6C2YTZ0_9BACT|nr:GIY-YIG nuclease family protein [Tuwongella immobilis]VIP04861.1 excinuclease abc subunit c : Excinuclease ABC subunit C OS=Rhodopirellula maiorica SM1 GN=RMSM_06429 PE=4 SV=1: GIY-YIG: UVR [Tuwongella immobilis]VTS07081.1 excinuclease abc subunit c : Excinuclease ABC subunit C OS=Rhodopirellula maiorica SM1 GN=RMSM_06429 PE=4 SV=1: GIY-YIG: UVR [Tuwongella immobilis]